MNLKIEEILILIVAFVIGYFVSNMISGSKNNSIVKVVSGKHTTALKCQTAEDCHLGDICVASGYYGKCVKDEGNGYGEKCHYSSDCKHKLYCIGDPKTCLT
jgi:hypothetical protein